METKKVTSRGFTIVELLTVMAVIAVLIGLLIPALALVKDNAKEIQQKAQFHGLDVGIELYKSQFGAYPPSNDNNINTSSSPENPDDNTVYCGANKLAEAMVGRDLLGFHPNSDFRSDGMAEVSLTTTPPSTGEVTVYSAFNDTTNWETADENMKARKGPFIDLENANAFAMDDVYGSSNSNFAGGFSDNYAMDTIDGTVSSYPLVLCDVYAKKRSGTTNAKKTGTPILYYRARTNYTMQDSQDTDGIEDDIYYYDDNSALLDLGMPDDGIAFTLLDTTNQNVEENFEDMIINENIQTVLRPYRADTYILISAGKDGDFGTADDIYNFEKDIIE